MTRWAVVLSASLALVGLVGCGSSSDVPAPGMGAPEVEYAKSVKALVADLAQSYKQAGLDGLKSGIEGAVENMEAYEENPVGEHEETYKQIAEGVQSLQQLLQGSPKKSEVEAKLKELQSLADKLPTQ